MNARVQLFGAVHAALESELDWERLGQSYCEGDARTFFDGERRERMLEVGLRIADELARRLVPDAALCSVYLGGAVGELAPILVEHLVLGRKLFWLNLDTDETKELARAIQAVGSRLGTALPVPSSRSLDTLPEQGCDHLWMVSVLTDPDAFPALHDELYQRKHGALATGRGSLKDDRRRAEDLGRALLRCAAPACTLSTSDEELVVLGPLLDAMGIKLEVPKRSLISALVGDRIRFCGLRRGG